MRIQLFPIALLCAMACSTASARDEPASEISQDRLKASVAALVGFGTRHTLSHQDDPNRGIGAARDWGEQQFRAISAACGECLQIVLPERMIEGDRVPKPTRLVDIVAIQPGTERPNEVVIVQAHIDSRASDPLDFTSDAPGANDDGSGSALVIEAARVLSQHKYPATIVFALLSGEEQGLYGGKLLADYAAEHGWTVKAVLNDDIVGGGCGSDGICDDQHLRVFSEGLRGDAKAPLLAALAAKGGENDSPGRNLSRFVDRLAEKDPAGLDVRQVWRRDRIGRGGDQIPFLEHGYPAIRFTTAIENYDHQHQDVRVENGVDYGDTQNLVDFAYLGKATRLNVRMLAALANAPMPPAPVMEAAVSSSTRLEWQPVAGAVRYNVWRRATDHPQWDDTPLLAGVVEPQITLDGVRGDDWFLGVSALAADGSESPIASAVPGGAFGPIAP